MKHPIAILPIFLLSLLVVPAPAAGAGPVPDLASAAAADGRFETLLTALRHTGLDATLRTEGPFTVFAPTDEAFAALPEGALADLLRPENMDALRLLLLQHVTPGRILSTDLLTSTSAPTLAGAAQALGLRVGGTNVVQADLVCSNGVIHVIDGVLLAASPVTPATPATPVTPVAPADVKETLAGAIRVGAPAYNEGRIEECARLYQEAAEHLVAHGGEGLSDLDRMDLQAVLASASDSARERAWKFREAFDRILGNLAFEPVQEAELPAGFPAPGPVGHVVVKRYPRYRAARAEGGNSFWTLFQHIKKNDVEMTAPVEMTMDEGMRATDMAFLYPSPTQGASGRQGGVRVLDLESIEVASVGVRGRRGEMMLQRARAAIEAHLAHEGLEVAGDWRVMGYNSPMVPAARQYWELQVPVRR